MIHSSLESLIEFIRSIYPDKDPVYLHEPQFVGNEKKYLEECIDSTFVSSVGPFVGRFEEAIATFLTSPWPHTIGTVACVNGTAALHLALMVAGVQPGDRVITQPLTFIATANAIRYCGAEPVFVDIDRDTMGMSPDALKNFLQSDRSTSRIAAILPMHTFGHPCRIDEIVAIAHEYNIPVIEDAAESIGSYYHDQHTGTFGDFGILSFNGNKTITTGGGGMIITKDPETARQIRHLSTQAKVDHPWKFYHNMVGYNFRMPNINAALGLAQLESMTGVAGTPTEGGMLQRKRQLAEKYRAFCDAHGIKFVNEPEGSRSNYWLNTILLNDHRERDEFLQYAHEQHVMCRPAWELMHTLPMYKECQRGDLSNAEWVAERVVNLPSSPV